MPTVILPLVCTNWRGVLDAQAPTRVYVPLKYLKDHWFCAIVHLNINLIEIVDKLPESNPDKIKRNQEVKQAV